MWLRYAQPANNHSFYDLTNSRMLSLNLTDSDFTILGVPERFELAEEVLAERWQALLLQTHPDQFSAQGPAAQRVATQWSIRINEAYQRLKNPVTRATLLCEQAGVPINAETNTAMPTDFLMQQIEWREALDEAQNQPAAQAVLTTVQQESKKRLSALAWLIDEKGDFEAAAQQVRSLMFIERFQRSVRERLQCLK